MAPPQCGQGWARADGSVSSAVWHEQASTTERYAHLADDPLRAVADKPAIQIAAAMSGQQDAEVVELKKSPA